MGVSQVAPVQPEAHVQSSEAGWLHEPPLLQGLVQELTVWQVEPSQPARQLHVLGPTQVPPFWQAGLQIGVAQVLPCHPLRLVEQKLVPVTCTDIGSSASAIHTT